MNNKIMKSLEIVLILIIIIISFHLLPIVSKILGIVLKIMLPFLISFIIAFLFEPIIKVLERKIPRKIAVIIICSFLVSLIIIIFKLVIPFFGNKLGSLIEKIPDYFDQIEVLLSNLNNKIGNVTKKFELDFDKLESLLNAFLNSILTKIGSFVQQTISYLFAICIMPILIFIFMNDYKEIYNFVKEKTLKNESLYNFLKESKDSLYSYFKGVFIVMIFMVLATFSVFYFLKIENPLIIGIIIGLTDIIPYIGPYIGGAFAIVLAAVSNPSKVLVALVAVVCIQLFENNILVPRIQSKTMQTKPLFVILSIAVFGEILGFIGIIIAVPLSRIIEIFIKSFFISKKTKN